MKIYLSIMNLKIKSMQHRINKLKKQVNILYQKNYEHKWYIKRLKHNKKYKNIARFKRYDMVKLKNILDKSHNFLKYVNRYKKKRYLKYFTRNELSKLSRILKCDYRKSN